MTKPRRPKPDDAQLFLLDMPKPKRKKPWNGKDWADLDLGDEEKAP
jgi:hypothetical protein